MNALLEKNNRSATIVIITILLSSCGNDDSNVYKQKIEQKEQMEKSLHESFNYNKQQLDTIYKQLNDTEE